MNLLTRVWCWSRRNLLAVALLGTASVLLLVMLLTSAVDRLQQLETRPQGTEAESRTLRATPQPGDGPSVDETRKFLMEMGKRGLSCGHYRRDYRFLEGPYWKEEFRFWTTLTFDTEDRLVITTTSTSAPLKPGEPELLYVHIIPVKDLNPARVQLRTNSTEGDGLPTRMSYSILLDTTNQRRTIRSTSYISGKRQDGLVDSTAFECGEDEDAAKRLLKALRRLVELEGGKQELFEP